MDNHKIKESLNHNGVRHSNTQEDNNNNIDVNRKKIISLDSNDVQVYKREGIDENVKLIEISNNNASLNPFAAALDMWQNYVKSWNNACNHLFFRNPPMTNCEFWFMYFRFDSKSNKKIDEK